MFSYRKDFTQAKKNWHQPILPQGYPCSTFGHECLTSKFEMDSCVTTRSRVPVDFLFYILDILGGNPAAPSSTATLLRLHPSHQFYLRYLPPRLG